jgi:hypothetical protein
MAERAGAIITERAGAIITEVDGSQISMVSKPQVTIDVRLIGSTPSGDGQAYCFAT